jgi:hypothetical protein
MSEPKRPGPRPGHHPLWLLALAALIAWQAWMALSLFGPDAWHNLTSDEPLLAGRHPLHLYHGHLGARALLERGSLSVYDPSFHAGYPKTPVFDSGSRPAELSLALVGGRFCPASYKIMQALICLLVPFAVYIGARGLGLARGTSVLAALLAQAVWWGRPGRESLEAGDTDLLLASLLAVCQAGLLVRYHDRPGILSLLGAAVTGLGGWFAHPMLMILLLPSFFLYYLSAGQRHGVGWHLPLFGGLLLAIGANSFWLIDLIYYWWVRVPPDFDTPLVSRTFAGLWRSGLWGDALDRVIGCVIFVTALVGFGRLSRMNQNAGAYLFAAAGVGTLALAVGGLLSDLLGRLGMCQLILPALLFACPPCACAIAWALGHLKKRTCTICAPIGLLLAACLAAWLFTPAALRERAARLIQPQPWEVGLGQGRSDVVRALHEQTDADARILWEDRPPGRGESSWTALLPSLTGRCFVGGLDSGAGIEHTATGLVAGRLAGRPIKEWADSELADYCREYNVRWVVAWSAEANARLARWSPALERVPLPAEGLTLWKVPRRASFALVGKATCVQAGPTGIVLADVRPETHGKHKGTVQLSLHYQKGMKVSPPRVRIQPAEQKRDLIPFVRLKMDQPAGRVLITWEGR